MAPSIKGVSTRSRGFRVRLLVLGIALAMVMVTARVPAVCAYPSYPIPSTASIDVSVVYATYADLDHGGVANDVFSLVRFKLGYSSTYEFYYLITLTLPSGSSYSYLVWVFAWYSDIYIYNVFLNHATESGDYTIAVDALLVSPDIATDTGIYVFDPPGGSGGGEPQFIVC
jgi:hypothetical protein